MSGYYVTVLGGFPKTKRIPVSEHGKPLVFETRAIARRWLRARPFLREPKAEEIEKVKRGR